MENFLRPNESALQFLHRCKVKPLEFGLYFVDAEIKDGLLAGEILEIVGNSQTGKTTCLMRIISQCIMPHSVGECFLGGQEVDVVLFDCDLRFNIVRLAEILERQVLRKLDSLHPRGKPTQGPTQLQTQIDAGVIQSVFGSEDGYHQFLHSCLSRLHVYQCASHFQLAMTLHRLRFELRGQPSHSIRLLMIDSASAFLWSERLDDHSLGGGGGGQSSTSPVCSALRTLLQEQKLSVITTAAPPFSLPSLFKPGASISEFTQAFLKGWPSDAVRYRFVLTPLGNSAEEAQAASLSWETPDMDPLQRFGIVGRRVKPASQNYYAMNLTQDAIECVGIGSPAST